MKGFFAVLVQVLRVLVALLFLASTHNVLSSEDVAKAAIQVWGGRGFLFTVLLCAFWGITVMLRRPEKIPPRDSSPEGSSRNMELLP